MIIKYKMNKFVPDHDNSGMTRLGVRFCTDTVYKYFDMDNDRCADTVVVNFHINR